MIYDFDEIIYTMFVEPTHRICAYHLSYYDGRWLYCTWWADLDWFILVKYFYFFVYFTCISFLYLTPCFILIEFICALTIPKMGYQLKIYWRYPSTLDPYNKGMHENMMFWRDVISRFTLSSSDLMNCFVSYVNPTMGILANMSLEEEVLGYWEVLCRDGEFLIY